MMDGIDVSMWQGDINLATVTKGLDFVIVKATEGVGYTDPEYKRNVKKVRTAKKLLGLYHYARADGNKGAAGARKEAAWFVQTAGDAVGEAILILDWEKESLPAGPAWAKVWLEEVERLSGVRPFFYCYPDALASKDFSAILRDYPLWLASYGMNTSSGILSDDTVRMKLSQYGYGRNPVMYQYLSTGRLAGYNGNLDLNKAFFNANKWREYASKGEDKMPRMQSPVKGSVSSPYGSRWGTLHAGIDIAAPLGSAVFPLFRESTVVRVVSNRVPGQTSAGHPIPGKSPNGVLLRNPDGEHQWFGHIKPAVKVGQKVTFDTVLGHIDLSGQTTGPHVHVETWLNSNVNSHRDPMIYFNYHGITPGAAPFASPTGKDWFDMASKKDLEDAIWSVLSTHNINISGAAKRALGADQRSAFSLMRYGAAALFEGREWHADLVAQNKALTAAVEALAEAKGGDPVDLKVSVQSAVDKALADLKVTLVVEDDLVE